MKTSVDGHAVGERYPAAEGAQGLEDPVLQELAQILISATDSAIAELSELVTPQEAGTGLEPAINQDTVDNLTADIVGNEALDAVKTAGELFAELDRTTKAGNDNSSLLRDCVSTLVFVDPSNRDQGRRMRGPHIAKCRKLIDFWDGLSTTLTPELAKQALSEIVRPVREMTDQRGEVLGQDPVQLASIRELLSRHESIDTTTKLSAIKFLVFGSILEIYKQEDVVAACSKGQSESIATINDSVYGPHYWAATLLADMKTEYRDALNGETGLLLEKNSKGRLMRIPSRKFRDTMINLHALGDLYICLEAVEEALKDLPTDTSAVRNVETRLVRFQAGELVANVLRLQRSSYDKMVQIQDAKQDAADEEGRHAAWEEAIRFEAVIVSSSNSLATCLDELGIQIQPNYRRILDASRTSRLSTRLDKIAEQIQENELLEAAEAVSQEILAIDGQYVLPNKRFRERAPELIGLAKVLSDSLHDDNAPLAEQDARALVGLMLGVYWERTGQDASVQDLAKQYLEDAEQIRTLTAKLESLGYQEDSQLIKLVNLLDELIDSGLFDNVKKHPEFQAFEDFILAYIIAKDPHEELEAAPVIDIPDEQEDEPMDVPAVPVEAIGQAAYEDIKVFPPSSSSTDVIKDFVENIDEKDMPTIEWERIKKLIELRDQFTKQNLQVQLIRTQHASWQVLPFFVLEVKLPGSERGVAVVESPVYGNATYVYREASDRLNWRDLVQLERQEARELGAVPAVHVDSKKLDVHFKKLWNRVISELTIAQ